jgi:hypothetical protein
MAEAEEREESDAKERDETENEEQDDAETDAQESDRTEAEQSDDAAVSEEDATAPGDWERKPADEEDLRHDDGTEPLPEPSDDDDDDLAEREAGEVSAGDDEGFDRPDPPEEAGLEDSGDALEEHGEPLLQGPEVKTPVGGVPTRSLLAMAAFIVVFCIVFFALWGLLGNIGIFLGIFVGGALGLGAMKLLADRERTA